MKKLILLRGPSGSGKSTISDHLRFKNDWTKSVVHEADNFFMDGLGFYHFDMTKLKSAHQWNQLQVEREMLHGVGLVICANTFIAYWEMERYFELAEEYNYEIEIIRTPGPWDAEVLFERNKHNVPLDVIKRHISGYKPHLDETEWSNLSIFK
jgi:predicted kinase